MAIQPRAAGVSVAAVHSDVGLVEVRRSPRRPTFLSDSRRTSGA